MSPASSDLDDLRLVATDADRLAFDRLVERYRGLVYSVCRRVLRDENDAADATQETFMILWQRAAEIRDSLGGWLHAAANSVSCNRIRSETRRRHRERRSHDESPSLPSASVEDPMQQHEIRAVIDDCLAELSADQRGMVVQHFWSGRSLGSLAEEAGVSKSAMKKRMDNCLEHLRQRLGRRGVQTSLLLLISALLAEAPGAVPAPLAEQLTRLQLPEQLPRPAGTPSFAKPPVSPSSVMPLALGLGGLGCLAAMAWWLVPTTITAAAPPPESVVAVIADQAPSVLPTQPVAVQEPTIEPPPIVVPGVGGEPGLINGNTTSEQRPRGGQNPAVGQPAPRRLVAEGQLFPVVDNDANNGWPQRPQHQACPIRMGSNPCMVVLDEVDPRLVERKWREGPGAISHGLDKAFVTMFDRQQAMISLNGEQAALSLVPRVQVEAPGVELRFHIRPSRRGDGTVTAVLPTIFADQSGTYHAQDLRSLPWTTFDQLTLNPDAWQLVRVRVLFEAADDASGARPTRLEISSGSIRVMTESWSTSGRRLALTLAGGRAQLRDLSIHQLQEAFP